MSILRCVLSIAKKERKKGSTIAIITMYAWTVYGYEPSEDFKTLNLVLDFSVLS